MALWWGSFEIFFWQGEQLRANCTRVRQRKFREKYMVSETSRRYKNGLTWENNKRRKKRFVYFWTLLCLLWMGIWTVGVKRGVQTGAHSAKRCNKRKPNVIFIYINREKFMTEMTKNLYFQDSKVPCSLKV